MREAHGRLQWPGGAMLGPVPPVLVTSGTPAAPNACTVAWCGTVCTKPPVLYISLRKQRHSYGLIMAGREFVVNLPTAALARAIDYCGVKSGRDEDKLAACGLHTLPSFVVAPPAIAESPLALECRLRQVTELGSHDMLLADVVAVAVDESLVDKAGKLHLDRAGLLAYAHGGYFALGQQLGSFGYSVKKRRKPR